MSEFNYGLIIHGGAWDIPDETVSDHLKGMKNAREIGYPLLEEGTSALDVVEEVVAYLEDDATFDAGKGSFLNTLGEIEMDAIIATDEYKLASICGIQNVRNPVRIARKLLENNGPVILIGKGANIFAKQQGFCETDPTELLTGRELERYHQIKNDPNFIPKVAFSGKGHGTVGCVAMDKKGRVAVAVSTGGTVMKPPGRVGDTPIFGSGAYINPKGLGVAATGYGEDLIRCMISHSVYEYSLNSSSIQQATELAIDNMYKTVQGFGGVIALGKKGFGLQWNTPRMAFSVQTDTFSAFEGIEYSDKEKLLS